MLSGNKTASLMAIFVTSVDELHARCKDIRQVVVMRR